MRDAASPRNHSMISEALTGLCGVPNSKHLRLGVGGSGVEVPSTLRAPSTGNFVSALVPPPLGSFPFPPGSPGLSEPAGSGPDAARSTIYPPLLSGYTRQLKLMRLAQVGMCGASSTPCS